VSGTEGGLRGKAEGGETPHIAGTLAKVCPMIFI
jgi:hypothetical protein